MSAPPDRPSFRRLVYPLALTVGVGFGALLYGFSVLVTTQGAGSTFSGAVLSTAFSGSILAGAAVAVPIGRYADRHGIRRIVAVGGGLVASGFALFALSTTAWQVLAAWWLLIGPGSAMVLFDPAFVALEQWFDPHDRNRAAGTLTLITGLAGPVFVPATTAAVRALGWRPTAGLLGALVLAAAWTTAGLALRSAPRPVRTGRAGRSLRAPGAIPRGFVALTAAIACGMAALEGIQVHRLARFESTGFDLVTLAFWAAAASLLSLPGRFFLPRLASRLPSPKLLLGVTLLLLPAFVFTVRGRASWEMVGHFVLFGALFGAVLPLRTVVMGDRFRGPTFGALMGLQAVAIAVGRATGPALVGWLGDTPPGYPLAMGLLTALVGASACLQLMALRTHERSVHSAPS